MPGNAPTNYATSGANASGEANGSTLLQLLKILGIGGAAIGGIAGGMWGWDRYGRDAWNRHVPAFLQIHPPEQVPNDQLPLNDPLRSPVKKRPLRDGTMDPGINAEVPQNVGTPNLGGGSGGINLGGGNPGGLPNTGINAPNVPAAPQVPQAPAEQSPGLMESLPPGAQEVVDSVKNVGSEVATGASRLANFTKQGADVIKNTSDKIITPVKSKMNQLSNWFKSGDNPINFLHGQIRGFSKNVVVPLADAARALNDSIHGVYEDAQRLPEAMLGGESSANQNTEGSGGLGGEDRPPEQNKNEVERNAYGGEVPRYPFGGMGFPYGMAGGLLGQPMSRNQFHLGMSLMGNPNSQNVLKNTNQMPWQNTLQNYMTYNVAPKMSTFYGDQYGNTSKYLMQSLGNKLGSYGSWSAPNTNPPGAMPSTPGFVPSWVSNTTPTWHALNPGSFANYNLPTNPTGGGPMPNMSLNTPTGFMPGRGFAYGGEVPRYAYGGYVPKFEEGGETTPVRRRAPGRGIFQSFKDTFMEPLNEAARETGLEGAPMAAATAVNRKQVDLGTSFGNNPYARNANWSTGSMGSIISPNSNFNQNYYPNAGQTQNPQQIQGAPQAPVQKAAPVSTRYRANLPIGSNARNPYQAMIGDANTLVNNTGLLTEDAIRALESLDTNVSPLLDKVENSINVGGKIADGILGKANDVMNSYNKAAADISSPNGVIDQATNKLQNNIFGENNTGGMVGNLEDRMNNFVNSPTLNNAVSNVASTGTDQIFNTLKDNVLALPDMQNSSKLGIGMNMLGQAGRVGASLIPGVGTWLAGFSGGFPKWLESVGNRWSPATSNQQPPQPPQPNPPLPPQPPQPNPPLPPQPPIPPIPPQQGGGQKPNLSNWTSGGIGDANSTSINPVSFGGGLPTPPTGPNVGRFVQNTPKQSGINSGFMTPSSSDDNLGGDSVHSSQTNSGLNGIPGAITSSGSSTNIPSFQQQPQTTNSQTLAYGGDVPRYAMGSRGILTSALENALPMGLGGAGLGAFGGYMRTKDGDYLQKMLPWGIGTAASMGILGALHGMRPSHLMG